MGVLKITRVDCCPDFGQAPTQAPSFVNLLSQTLRRILMKPRKSLHPITPVPLGALSDLGTGCSDIDSEKLFW